MIYHTDINSEASAPALVVDGPQPVWMTLNEARERAFTGEIVFETHPEVVAYLDHGIVYYAERVTDASLGRRLLDAGVVDVGQLDRGTVRVGDIEHLGRLFDRDPSVDRDAVVVVAETATEELIAELANQAVASVRITAYRHHPSGVHRWFVAPLDPAVQRPMSEVAQLDSAVVDQLPGLSFAGSDELTIEWDDEILDGDERFDDGDDDVAGAEGFDGSLLETDDRVEVADVRTDEPVADPFELLLDDEFIDGVDDAVSTDAVSTVDVVPDDLEDADFIDDVDDDHQVDDVADVETIADSRVDDVGDEAAVDSLDEAVVVDDVVELDQLVDVETDEWSGDFEYCVVWPDGSEAPAAGVSSVPSPDVEHMEGPLLTESDDGDLTFTMPPLQLGDEPEQADRGVPADVADAVRRAIAAIETAIVESPPAASGAPAPDVTAGGRQVDERCRPAIGVRWHSPRRRWLRGPRCSMAR